MEFNELISSRHSTREYSDKAIPQETLDKILSQAQLAPTSRGKKPVKLICATDGEMLEKLSLAKKAGSSFIKNAGAAIVVACDTQVSDVWVEDGSIAMTYLHLAAENAGLGSCWIQCRNRFTEKGQESSAYIKQLLSLDDNFEVVAILSLGNKK